MAQPEKKKPEKARAAQPKNAKPRARDQQQIKVIGKQRHPIRDLYHGALRLPWSKTLIGIVLVFLALNAIFGMLFLIVGGVAHARPGSFADAFFFSVQTMGTIGYGAMYPESAGANTLVVIEAVVSMLVTAVATGLVFAKFSRSTARIVFSTHAIVTRHDGEKMLMFRVGNDRESLIYEATVRVGLIKTEILKEGDTFYRLYDMKLVRERSSALSRSFTVMHRIDEASPLHGATPESLEKDEVEISVTLSGTDDTSMQPVHARHTYYHDEIAWNHRYADILTDTKEGLIVDLRNFHVIEPLK